MTDRLLPWFACMLLVFAAASDTATAQGSAAPSTIFAKPASQVVMVTGRPGTRNYEPDDVGAATLAKHDASSSAETPEAWQQRLEECMASWDNKTHITKDDWRKICVRELSDEWTRPAEIQPHSIRFARSLTKPPGLIARLERIAPNVLAEAEGRSRKRVRDVLPRRITEMHKSGVKLIKRAKGLR
jgi:hypothetical protein